MPSDIPTLSQAHVTWRWKILLSTYFGYAGFYLTRNVFSVCKTTLAEDFHVTLHEIAHLGSAFLIAYCIGQFLVSGFGRRASARVLLITGLGASIVVSMLFGIQNSYWTFMLLMFVNGLVQAMGWPGSVGAVAEWLRPQERSLVMGLWSTNLIVGNMTVKALSGWLLGHYGWRAAYFGCALLSLITWFFLLVCQRDRPADVGLRPLIQDNEGARRPVRVSNAPHLAFSDFLLIVKNPIVILMALSYFCVKFLRYSIDSWLPTFFQYQGLEKAQSAYWATICDLAGIPGMVLTGWIVTRWFRGNWAIICVLLGIGMALGYRKLTTLGPDPLAIAFCYGLIGFMVLSADSLLKGFASIQVAGERNGAAVAGIVNGVASISPVLQEEIIGYWMDKGTVGIRLANALSLGMTLFFIFAMSLLLWQSHRQGRLAFSTV